jgi:predicted CXXCH cytochrome family protein
MRSDRWQGLVKTSLAILVWSFCSVAVSDIRLTPHSLVKKTSSTTKSDGSEVCVFCHTPNVSGTPPQKPPLWQKSAGTTHEFVIYDDIGRLGLGKDSVGSQSIACLSCHDSVQAISVSKTSSDHPFGVPYRGATKNKAQSTTSTSRGSMFDGLASAREAKLLVNLEDFRDVSQGVVEGRSVFWVSKSGITARRTRNDLPLYPRKSEDSGGESMPHIECSSCHDPHSENETFLRVPPEGSQLCLTCHIK